MLKNISKLGRALNKAEQKKVTGGKRASFSCYCGFVDSEGLDQTTWTVHADSIGSALNSAGASCGGYGATCSGI